MKPRSTPTAAPDHLGGCERAEDFRSMAPGLRFYLACTLTALAVLWASTHPGYVGVRYEGAFYIGVLLGLYWLLRLVLHVKVEGRHRRRFLIAPIGALLLGTLLWSEVPFHARWAGSEAAFDAAVAALPQGEVAEEWASDDESLDVEGRLGTYRIARAERVPGGVLFEVPGGCGWYPYSGFGWFPSPPDPAAVSTLDFTKPVFWHLDGPWYGWCASS